MRLRSPKVDVHIYPSQATPYTNVMIFNPVLLEKSRPQTLADDDNDDDDIDDNAAGRTETKYLPTRRGVGET